MTWFDSIRHNLLNFSNKMLIYNTCVINGFLKFKYVREKIFYMNDTLWFKIEKKRTFTSFLGKFGISISSEVILVEDIKIDFFAKFQVFWCCIRDSRAV